MSASRLPPGPTAPIWRWSPMITSFDPAASVAASRRSMAGSSAMPASSQHTTVRLSNLSWPWSSRHSSDAMVRGSSMPASVPRVRAAWPETAVPSTRNPAPSNARRAASRAVLLPEPATPTTSSTPRPEVATAVDHRLLAGGERAAAELPLPWLQWPH